METVNYVISDESTFRRLLTVQQTKQYLNIGINQVYRLCKQSDFPALKIGKKLFIDLEGLNVWIEKQKLSHREFVCSVPEEDVNMYGIVYHSGDAFDTLKVEKISFEVFEEYCNSDILKSLNDFMIYEYSPIDDIFRYDFYLSNYTDFESSPFLIAFEDRDLVFEPLLNRSIYDLR